MKQKPDLRDLKKIAHLEETNKRLQQAVNTLMRRVALLERKTNVTANTARNSVHKLTQIGRTLQLTEGKVQRVENILRRY